MKPLFKHACPETESCSVVNRGGFARPCVNRIRCINNRDARRAVSIARLMISLMATRDLTLISNKSHILRPLSAFPIHGLFTFYFQKSLLKKEFCARILWVFFLCVGVIYSKFGLRKICRFYDLTILFVLINKKKRS